MGSASIEERAKLQSAASEEVNNAIEILKRTHEASSKAKAANSGKKGVDSEKRIKPSSGSSKDEQAEQSTTVDKGKRVEQRAVDRSTQTEWQIPDKDKLVEYVNKETQTRGDLLSDAFLPEEREKAREFFEKLLEELPGGDKRHEDLAILHVSHLFPEDAVLFSIIQKKARYMGIIPKTQSSKLEPVEEYRELGYPITSLNRANCSDADAMAKYLQSQLKPNEKLVIVDHGGYFAPSITKIHELLGEGKILGVVENTMNGYVKYREQGEVPLPIITLAHSELKNSIEPAVGASVKRITENILRNNGIAIQDKQSLVLGYGPVGQEVADQLGKNTKVFDIKNVKMVSAVKKGYEVVDRESAIRNAKVIFCATGSKSIKEEDYAKLQEGCIIAAVTSADDEIEMPVAPYKYTEKINDLHRYENSENGHFFYLINNGGTVNFTGLKPGMGHGILAVQAMEMLSFERIYEQQGKLPNGLQDLPIEEEEKVAKQWMQILKGFQSD
jgi:adenosylhomocysteinase